jgi:ribosome recycling factor
MEMNDIFKASKERMEKSVTHMIGEFNSLHT